MRKLFTTLILGLLFTTPGLAAWDAAKPADNGKIKEAPAEIRANWAALATGTDAALCVNNAKLCAAAAIGDDKMAQITSPAKVSGAALTLLGSIPSSANGQVPIANGGTGQSTATAAATALLPTQTGNSGKALVTNATVQSWGYPASLTIASAATGDLLYYNGTAWVRLAAGTNTYFLKAAGAAAPAWKQPNVADGPVMLDGTAKLPAVDGSALTGILTTSQVTYTTPGANSWTAPTGVYRVMALCTGAGGGGGGGWNSVVGGGGGGSGGTVLGVVFVTPGNSYSASVGAFGAGSAGNAAAGGNSTFSGDNSGVVTGGGGGGGKGGTGGFEDGDGGSEGSGTVSGKAFAVSTVSGGIAGSAHSGGAAGGGASSAFGDGVGGVAAPTANDVGGNATGYAAGGGGGGANSKSGGNGTQGFITLFW